MPKTEEKMLLHHAIAHYFQTNGFPKSLKKFLSEAKLDQDEIKKVCSFDLKEVYNKFLETRSKSNTISNGSNDQELQAVSKKKKKTSEKSESDGLSILKESVNDVAIEPITDELKEKNKEKKKKSKSKLEVEKKKSEVESEIENENPKKKKKGKPNLETFSDKSMDVSEEDKDMKKRKRSVSEENNSEPNEKIVIEKCKRRKTEETQTDTKPIDALSNGSLVNHVEDLSVKKNSKKQQINGSAEPKTVNAFQRVKVDKIVFPDERLQDNSYWAKDGAEIGYGAKAQEILGQVRGKDFRHEKTKKKRGSYRGGQIDFDSHSIKFVCSDED